MMFRTGGIAWIMKHLPGKSTGTGIAALCQYTQFYEFTFHMIKALEEKNDGNFDYS